MASQRAESQRNPSPPQGAPEAPSTIEPRSIRTPERTESRRVGRKGTLGSQKASRFVFNEAYWREARFPGQRNKPISRSLAGSISLRAREVLYNTLKIPRGKLTHTQMRNKWDLQPARRLPEKYFPVLGLAENQWAATYFLQEVARRDKKKEVRIASGVGGDEGDQVPEEAVGSSQRSSEESNEVGVFGEGLESQEVASIATRGLRNECQGN